VEVTSDLLEVFLDDRDLSAKTRYTWLSNLHAFYGWAQRLEPAIVDPTVFINRPRLRQGLPRPMADVDLDRALAAGGPCRRAAVMLGAYAGLRCAEIAWLERDWLDEDREALRVFGKGAKTRVVALHPAVLDALVTMGMPRAGRVFRRPSGGPFTPEQLSRWMNLWLHSVGVTATMHTLRHWFGTETYRVSKDLRAVQELLGHSTPTVTAVYTKLDGEGGRAAVRALPLIGGLRP
jgi:site-specific recombinase XerC